MTRCPPAGACSHDVPSISSLRFTDASARAVWSSLSASLPSAARSWSVAAYVCEASARWRHRDDSRDKHAQRLVGDRGDHRCVGAKHVEPARKREETGWPTVLRGRALLASVTSHPLIQQGPDGLGRYGAAAASAADPYAGVIEDTAARLVVGVESTLTRQRELPQATAACPEALASPHRAQLGRICASVGTGRLARCMN